MLFSSREPAERHTMMTLPNKKKHSFKLFLAFYFLFFSVSPLTYAFSNKQAPEIIYSTVQKSPSIRTVHLLPSASSPERRSAADETPHADQKTRVLVKKKRAIASEDPFERISLFPTTSAQKNDFRDPSAPTAARLNITPEHIVDISKGFDPLFAGNSPPSA